MGGDESWPLLGSMSKSLQKVEQFPWQIIKTQNDLIRKMADIQHTDKAGNKCGGQLDKDLIDVLVFLFRKSPKNYVHNKIIVLRWDGSIHVIYLLVWVDTP